MKRNLQKKLTLALFIFLSFTAAAQNVPINFEAGGNGATWTWTPFENFSNPAIQIVANPDASGINTSSTVLKMVALQAGQPWAGFESLHPGSIPPGTSDLGAFTLSSSNAIVKMMVYKSVISDVGIKFANASNGSTGELKVSNTVTNQWEELTFDFTSKIGEPTSTNIDQIIFFPDFNFSRTANDTCYIDNVTFNAVAAPIAPLVAAPVPTTLAANVISMFSNAYTNISMATWATGWSAATLTNLQIATNDTKKYSNLDYVGIEPSATIDASAMNTFNLDLWTPNATAFRIKLVDFGANGVWNGGGDDVEHELSFTPTIGGWNTYHIPLSNFTNLTTKGHIAQLILSANPTGTATAYVDNVYFSFESPLVPLVAAPTPTALAANVISMFSNAYTDIPMSTWATGWSAATLTNLQIATNDTKKYSNLDYVGIEPSATINATTMNTFNIDVWTPDATAFRIKLVDFGANGVWNGGGDDVEHELSFTPTLSGWNTYHIPLSDFINLTTKGHIAQLILSANPTGTATAYVDNVYFSYELPLVPMVPAPAPLTAATNVISLFSNAYTNVGVDTWRTSWSNATLTNLQIATNDTKRYSALDYVGIETTGPNLINATGMNYFNIDVWTPNATAFRIKLVDFGANGVWNGGGDDVEYELSFTPTLSGWNTFSIPLTNFVGLTTRAHIAQLILSANPTALADVYIDNVFFSTTSPLGVEILSFNAQLENNSVRLNWNTAKDENVQAYAIEKSIDANHFEAIGNVASKKVTTTANYQFVDNANAIADVVYYRLKQLNTNGSFSYSPVVNVKNNTFENIITPNPASNSITIYSNHSVANVAAICDAFGNIIKEVELSAKSITIDISALPIGMYFVKYNNGNSQQFVKQ